MTHPELEAEAAALLEMLDFDAPGSQLKRNAPRMAACIRNLLSALREAEDRAGPPLDYQGAVDRQKNLTKALQELSERERQVILNAEGKT